MVVILLTDNESMLQKNIKYAFELMSKDHSVETSNFSDALEFYQHNNPNITIVNFSDEENANKTIDDIMKFDSNACVLALSDNDEKHEDILKSGVNAIIPIPSNYNEDKINEVMDNLLSVCTVFNNVKCTGCTLHGNN